VNDHSQLNLNQLTFVVVKRRKSHNEGESHTMKEIFYQASLPRAGSTLLQNILGQNPDFYVTPTSGVLELVFGARTNFGKCPEFKAQDSEAMISGFRAFCSEGVKGFFNAITDKPYIVDKSRGWGVYYDFLSFYQDRPKVICMVRDLRDVFCSMEKQHRKAQKTTNGIGNDGDMEGNTTAKRVDMWANSQPVGLALDRLQQVLLENHPILFVRYEDLTTDPQTELDKIYDYLGVPRYSHNFAQVKQITEEDDMVYGGASDHTIRSCVKALPSDYDDVLGKQTADSIKRAYPWFYETFKYT
jgi:sulfotransferase